MVEEIPQSHIKLATTATAGAGGEHSPYARRALSAGYKGLIQGTIGGATLYGTFGTIIGGIVGTGIFLFTGNPAGFWAVPVIAGLGVYKGADTFGNIGAFAAISAESAEMNERRSALNERLQTTTSQAEANEIIRLLHEDTSQKAPSEPIHWKTVLVGAALGAIVIGGLVALTIAAPGLGIHFLADGAAGALLEKIGLEAGTSIIAASGIGAAIGGLAGATIGLDRYYVRKWFDRAESVVHNPEKATEIALARQQEATRLYTISRTDSSQQQPARIDTRDVAEMYPAPVAAAPRQEVYRYEDTPRPRVRVDNTVSVQRMQAAEEIKELPQL